MDFPDLYKFSEVTIARRSSSGEETLVKIIEVKEHLIQHMNWIEDINIYPIECKKGDPLGHYEVHGNQESRWEDSDAWTVLITYDDTLNQCYRRFVWCKELMHTFDSPEAFVDNIDKYKGFLEEIELQPLTSTEMYISENRAKWMALLILCPKSERDNVAGDVKKGNLSHYDVALRYRIPEGIVPSLFSESYNRAYNALVQNENNA